MSTRFEDDVTDVDAAGLNSLDRGGNVYAASGGGLSIDVSPFRWVKHSPWAVNDFAGATAQAVTGSTTNYVYVDTSNVLQINTSGFPGTAHIPLATVVTGGAAITSITDKRAMTFLP